MKESVKQKLIRAKNASFKMAVLEPRIKQKALLSFAKLIDKNADFLLSENKKDTESQKGKISPALTARLKLDQPKLAELIRGITDLSAAEDLVGKVQLRRKLDKDLILEKVSVPLGVLGIIFESRPDVIPQILSLVLKSGNTAVLKGGKEARHSNHAFMTLIEELNTRFPELPPHWAQLIDSRHEVHEMLSYPEYVDLVIPRGSYTLVKSIKEATKIPVLGHADGICHLYVHPRSDIKTAIPIILDAKCDYPTACNALETLLVDQKIARSFLPVFEEAAHTAGITLKGCVNTRKLIPSAQRATERDWSTEYGDLTLSIKMVDDLEAAITHINHYGSHHTDGILSQDRPAQEKFLQAVDSACVFVNASTRFSDGYRFGMGAEVGISTSKTHARGPVGIEGLLSTTYRLRGNGHIVATYRGPNPRPFLHTDIKI